MNAITAAPMPATVGAYRLAERLGEGGMGEVFRAVDTMLEREVALKVLRPEMGARAELVERFRVEAIALARLHHRHIAAVYSFFQQEGQHYIAMQYVRGRTLEAVLQQRGILPWREAAAVAMDVLQALEHAHALGVVHRDLKPANLMLDHEARTVVMDFGIARVLARSRQTRAGTLVGTLEYIAPEIVRGEAADARSDLYSLGCVLYEMVTGVLPFESASDFALMRAHAEQAPPRPIVRSGDLPPALEGVILRALEKQPARRFASAREFMDALSSVCGTPPPAPATRPMLSANALRRHAALARERAIAAIRWLSLPTHGGWQDWRAWARLNLGLTTAAGVAAITVVVGLAMATHDVCCSVRPAAQPVRWNHAAPSPQPAPAVEVAQPEPSPAPLPAMPPTLVVEPGAQVAVNDPIPLSRSVRPVPVVAPAAPKVRAVGERPSSPGWYVKR
ncbi:MAG: serine/threonine-protein kinase [Burkholderiales bacterium]